MILRQSAARSSRNVDTNVNWECQSDSRSCCPSPEVVLQQCEELLETDFRLVVQQELDLLRGDILVKGGKAPLHVAGSELPSSLRVEEIPCYLQFVLGDQDPALLIPGEVRRALTTAYERSCTLDTLQSS